MNNSPWLISAAAILLLLACNRSVLESQARVGEEFLLVPEQQIEITDINLEITAVRIIEGLDGSHEIGVGSVYLLVTTGDEQDLEIYLETGNTKNIGENEIEFIEVLSDQIGLKARLVVR